MDSHIHGQTVLVTGAAGFVGSHLVNALVDANEVIALDHFHTNSPEIIADGATIVKGDIRDQDLVDGLIADSEIIFHQAARRGVAESIEDPLETHGVNVDATLNLLKSACKSDVRIVLASSAAIYGDTTDHPIDESSPTVPISPYGTQKLAVDNYARNFSDLYGLETVVLRYFNVFGRLKASESYRSVLGVFIQQAENGGPLTIEGDGTQTRDFVHVGDVVRANLLAATTDHIGEAYNIGTGAEISINELAELVRDTIDPSITIEHVDNRSGEVQHSVANISKASRLLGYEPSITVTECLQRYQTRMTES